MKKIALIALFVLTSHAVIYAQQMTKIDSELGPGPTGAVYISSDTMITGEGVTLKFYDISTPSSPSVLGSHDVSEKIQDIAMDGKILYIATKDTLSMLDITSLGNVTRLAGENGNFSQIKISGDSLYGLMPGFIALYDVSSNNSFVSKHFYSFTGPIGGFDVSPSPAGDTLFVANSDSLRIVNYEGETTNVIGSAGLPMNLQLYKVQKVFSQVYAGSQIGIVRFEVDDGTAPALDGGPTPNDKKVANFFWQNDTIYAAADSVQFDKVWKVEAPAGTNTLTAVDSFTVFNTSVKINDLYVSGNNLILAGGGFGWELIDIPTKVPSSTQNTQFEVMDICADTGYVFAAQRFSGIKVFSYNNSDLTAETSYQSGIKKDFLSVFRYDKYLIAGYTQGIEVFDLTSLPGSITSDNVDNSIGSVNQIAVKDTALILSTGRYIKFYDVRTLTGSLNEYSSAMIDLGVGSMCEDMFIQGNFLYTADNNNLNSYDISNMGTSSTNLINCSDASPVISASMSDYDSLLFQSTSTGGIVVFDITDPANADQLTGEFNAPSNTSFRDIIWNGDYILALNNYLGIYAVEIPENLNNNFTQKFRLPTKLLATKLFMRDFYLFGAFETGIEFYKNPYGAAKFNTSKLSTFTDTDTIPVNIELVNDISPSYTDTNVYSFNIKAHFDHTLIDTIADAGGNIAYDLTGTMLGGAGYTIFTNYVPGLNNIDTVLISGAHSAALSTTPDMFMTLLFKPGTNAKVDTTANILYDAFSLNEGLPVARPKGGFVVYKPRIGDVSYNKEITGFDASLVLKHTVQIYTIPDDSVIWADVSNNGKIRAFDAALILQYVAGIINRFPAEDNYIFQKPAVSAAEEAVITYAYNYDETEGILSVPVSLENSGNIYSAEIELSHSGIEYKGFEIEKSNSHFISEAEDKGGIIKFAMAGPSPVSKDGNIITFYFKVNDKSSLEKLTFSRIILNEFEYDVSKIESNTLIPKTFRIHQNYPNPFNPVTNIKYELPNTGNVTLKIYNLLGQEVKTLVNKTQASGFYKLQWDGRNNNNILVSSGVYFYKIEYRPNSSEPDPKIITKKLLFIK